LIALEELCRPLKYVFLPFQYTPPTHLPSRGGDPFLYKSETILIRLEMEVISESIGKIDTYNPIY
jgi:hypothetical protein